MTELADRPTTPAVDPGQHVVGQHGFAYRFDWGEAGVGALAPHCDVLVIVDVLRFTTAVSTAVERNGSVRLSPNDSALTVAARECGARHVLAGCLRNATATARRARELAGVEGVIGVVAAGHSEPIRMTVEDLLGAGAVLAALDPSAAVSAPNCSPEAAAARAAFVAVRSRLGHALSESTSGRELTGRGWADDVATASHLDATTLAAELVDGAFVAMPT